MPSMFRIFSYGVVFTCLVLITIGGWGVLLPIMFNLHSMIMIIMVPLTVMIIMFLIVWFVRMLYRMVCTDLNKIRSD